MKALGLFMAALLWATSPASAAPCLTQSQLAAMALERYPQAKLRLLEREEAAAFMSAFNALPPPTAISADQVLIADLVEGDPAIRIALFEKGCMIKAGALPRPLAAKILNQLSRDGA
jgi:hypothetical protein